MEVAKPRHLRVAGLSPLRFSVGTNLGIFCARAFVVVSGFVVLTIVGSGLMFLSAVLSGIDLTAAIVAIAICAAAASVCAAGVILRPFLAIRASLLAHSDSAAVEHSETANGGHDTATKHTHHLQLMPADAEITPADVVAGDAAYIVCGRKGSGKTVVMHCYAGSPSIDAAELTFEKITLVRLVKEDYLEQDEGVKQAEISTDPNGLV